MSITLQWWMLVPLTWCLAVSLTYMISQRFVMFRDDFVFVAFASGIPAGLMIFTRVI